VQQKYITLLPIALLALSASYGIYSFSLLFVPWYIAGITALAFELTYCTLVFIDSSKARPVSIMAVIVSVLWNVGHSLFVLYPASLDIVHSSLWFSFTLSAIHGIPLATLAYLVADVSLHSKPDVTGEVTGNKELTRNEKIIRDKQGGMTYVDLSNKYGVSKRRVQQIVKGENSANNNV
jgi:predicted PurR-regulated permease PerM